MIGHEATVDGLKLLTKRIDWSDPATGRQYIDAMAQESDRGVIILSAGVMEQIIEVQIQTLMEKINGDERDRLFGFTGPIGTFSAKNRIAHALGLYPRVMFKKIELIRELRNCCAHSITPISFSQTAISNTVRCVYRGLNNDPIPQSDDPKAARKHLKQAYVWATMILSFVVTSGTLAGGQQKMQGVLRASFSASPDKQPEESG